MSRPVPVPTSLSRPFWEGTRRGELLIPCCTACGERFFVPEPACPACMSQEWTYRPSTGRGTVYSVTVVHRAPGPGFDAPFALAVIDLDDGSTMLSHVVGSAPEDVVIGMRVRVDFRAYTDEITLPYFVAEA
ncbi:OB-fold domain-containing protein [Yinghuangia sp. ASG 101]|uniref:Zn-ribbon domain-containing OB-fold protein n=1 Tax=Yinghuangia sp. ASG 101 TaxID=2896848 RepID=UPI001E59E239|nr:OB-fold domain-containing protein [Yinghuangia sp. ASG 101]UGQ11228.1 OB-fold domain-containing protein [Yinghuangia sp. ASG 101]